jgi:hypothetical protein
MPKISNLDYFILAIAVTGTGVTLAIAKKMPLKQQTNKG